MTKADLAEALFSKGYNCAQSVLCAFTEDLGVDMDTAMRMSSSLGGGLGHAGEVCGAVLGMAMAVGLMHGTGTTLPDMEAKGALNEKTRLLVEDFRAKFGSSGCDDLREAGNRTICMPYVRYAAALAERTDQDA